MDSLALREQFLEQIRPEESFQLLFGHIPGVLFFAKDLDGRLFAANQALLDLYGYKNADDFWGVTDFE